MEDVLLSVHVLAAIVFVGGSAVAASLFPRYAPVAAAPNPATGATGAPGPEAADTMAPVRDTGPGTAPAAAPVPAAGATPETGTAPAPDTGTAAAETVDTMAPAGDTGPEAAPTGERNRAVAASMHRITRGYALFGLIVPVAGIALALVQGRMGEIWVSVSMALTLVAGLLLATQIHPRQREALRRPGGTRPLRTLSMLAGVYNLVWAAVVVLMIVRPGSEAGA
ncbi:hypothetical protein [Nocardiopsis sp. NRRL B-16309]|uniref:hypothetical protein n=1 Tax=Nocardiopsis sp. NRRL B-16309 TaxID=1519494 RepID=UPI0006AEE86F|nr:hypothetical protein [Nocardiopsis sp. NRRL B-16309]KOX13845.1 hypothetical protein ADL05_17965 [Nocardiopsis sp. NRRL B-16309]